jgi:hypothetical protein
MEIKAIVRAIVNLIAARFFRLCRRKVNAGLGS